MEEEDKLKCILIDFVQGEITLSEASNTILRLFSVSDWHLFKDELPFDNEEILIRNGKGKEARRSKWKYSIYLNDLRKGMEWKRWADACR